jgi:hypothetical protein
MKLQRLVLTFTREGVEIRTLLTAHLEALIRSRLVQSRELSGRWSEMGFGELAISFGVLFDRTLRMLELHEGVTGGEGRR